MVELSLSDFADKVMAIMPLIIRESMKYESGDFFKVKLTLPQLVILNVLHREGEANMTDMAHTANVTTAAMTGIVDKLVKDGYLSREHSPQDRRIVKVRLTPKGVKFIERINESRKKTIMEIFGKISQKEREDYIRILTHIKEHLVRERE